jgi:hypothetical protein
MAASMISFVRRGIAILLFTHLTFCHESVLGRILSLDNRYRRDIGSKIHSLRGAPGHGIRRCSHPCSDVHSIFDQPMFDLDKLEIEIPCPRCGFYEPVTIKQVRLDDVVICRGCKSNLRLVDQMHQVANARGQLAAALRELADAFSKPINLTLRL